MPTADREGLRDADPNEVTPDMLAAAWEVVRARYPHGRVLGPGPGFREAIAAALARRPLCDLEARIVEAETTAEVDREFAETSRQQATAALADVARLSAEVERLRAERDEALQHLPEGLAGTSLAGAVQALAFSARSDSDSKWRWGHALTIGLAFADKAAGEEWEHGGMASIDVCYAMAATLKCECDSAEWAEMAKAGAARLAEHKAEALALAAGQDKEGGKLTDAGRLALAEQEKARG